MKKNDIAYDKIKKMILQGTISPQNPVSENILVAKLGMSRTPIRSALQRLSYDGFVTIIPNQGVIVKEPSIEEALNKMDVRIAVELYVVRRSFEYIGEEDIQNLYQILDQQIIAIKNQDDFSYLQLDKTFHSYLLKYYDNKLISQLIIDFRERFLQISLQKIHKRTSKETQSVLKAHEEIILAIKDKDLNKTLNLLEEHLRSNFMKWITS